MTEQAPLVRQWILLRTLSARRCGVTVKEMAEEFLGVSPTTIRDSGRSGKIPIYRNPASNYRLFKKADLEELLRQIEESGKYPTDWRRSAKPK